MKPVEHAARAMLLGKWYDAHTNSYRHRSPEGSNYHYSDSLDADTLEVLGKGVVREREISHFGHNGKGNSVSKKRLGIR